MRAGSLDATGHGLATNPIFPFVVKKVSVLDSVTVNALSSALGGLQARQTATANNIANINTPNYKSQVVSFENALAASVQAGSGVVSPTTQDSLEPTQLDGNNVNLDTEDVTNTTTVLQYQFTAQAINQELTSFVPALNIT
ncbi:MAG: flagellar basal-body rod protein FlgB [Actinomycetota bacterium]|jgi:flagellar basal-body rod protein FlgB|nr:flagellar biosynthesis protein FlgB [Glaciihabitans sp.]MDQ1560674.1 flagellar basal-body rod protein FlgB [Actinomycetota bacterium]